MDIITLLITVAVLTLATLGHAIFGFGGGLIAIPVLSILIGVRDAVTLSLVQQMVTVILLGRAIRHVNWRITGPVLAGMLPGTLGGILLLSMLDETILRIALAIFILLYLVKSIAFPNASLPGLRNRIWGAVTGFVGGSLQGLIGTGGPPVVIYMNEIGVSREVFRAGMLLLLAASNLIRIGISIPAGLFTDRVLEICLYTLPFFVLALWIGDKVISRMDERYYTSAVYMILAGSLILLISNLIR